MATPPAGSWTRIIRALACRVTSFWPFATIEPGEVSIEATSPPDGPIQATCSRVNLPVTGNPTERCQRRTASRVRQSYRLETFAVDPWPRSHFVRSWTSRPRLPVARSRYSGRGAAIAMTGKLSTRASSCPSRTVDPGWVASVVSVPPLPTTTGRAASGTTLRVTGEEATRCVTEMGTITGCGGSEPDMGLGVSRSLSQTPPASVVTTTPTAAPKAAVRHPPLTGRPPPSYSRRLSC